MDSHGRLNSRDGDDVVTQRSPIPFKETSVSIGHPFTYNSEDERLKSFAIWPSDSAVDPGRLAKSGFYYSGKDDEVICFSCQGHIRDWQYGDIVQRKHTEMFPHCDFVNNKSRNIPLSNGKLTETPRRFSEPLVNGISLTSNRIQKQLSVGEALLSNITDSPLTNSPIRRVGPNVSDMKRISISINVESLFREMKTEERRLRTFKNGWPVPFVDAQELASAGFFYLGTDDKVQCPFCGGIVSNWEVGDKPLEEHRRHFPQCTFISSLGDRRLHGGNAWFKGKGYDVCGDVSNSFGHHQNKLLDESQEHTKLEDLGVSLHRGPAHPQQATLDARLRSFNSWPSNIPVTKEDLSNAGFFYIGISDHTKCFHCNGGLCSWEDGDDPWEEHARWFRNCTFVRLNKGDEFIKSCITKHATVAQSQDGGETSDDTSISNDLVLKDEILKKTEIAMNSSLITAVLETGLLAPYLVRVAVMRELKESNSSFNSVDDLFEAVAFLEHEMGLLPPQPIETNNENLVSTLNIEMQPRAEEVEEKMEEMEISEPPIATNGCDEPGTSGVAKQELMSLTETKSQDTGMGNLEEENRFLKDQRLCKVCMDGEVGVVFLPCGHLLACTLCAPALKLCPMCRKAIQATVRAYLP